LTEFRLNLNLNLSNLRTTPYIVGINIFLLCIARTSVMNDVAKNANTVDDKCIDVAEFCLI